MKQKRSVKSKNKKYHTFNKTKLFFYAFFFCIATNAYAGEEPYLNELKGSQVTVGSFFTVSDEKFNSLSSGQWSLINHISVDNIVSFEINFDTSVYFYNQPFNCTVGFKIYIYGNQSDTSQVTDSVTHANISLNVIYDTITGKPYKGIALYKFKNVHKYKVKILSISCPQLSPILPIFRLKGQIIVNRKYDFQDASTDITRYSKVNGNQLNLEWSPSNYPGAEMFDLEFTHIDYSSQIAATILASAQSGGLYSVNTDSLAKWFKNNSTRITTASSSYLLNIPYDSGFILFRLRGVQIHYPDDVRWEGNWNYAAKHIDTACSGTCPTGVVFFAGHEPLLNWQYSIVFAEEGKRKEVISYFDGSLRNRQSVTLSNSDNKNIVQETIYDALGRPAASILPAPTNDSTIHYFRGFNRNSNNEPYSFSDLLFGSNCTTVADNLSDSSGTGKYYSSNNAFLNSYYYSKYIPDGGGYPFAVTEYMADNTGRIKAQGGVGRIFQLDSTHATRYYYGKPTQVELDRLFGLEAGNASHYLKNMVMDANGQISVSYMDAGGKTIATALAGQTPVNVHSLPSNGAGASVVVSNDLILPGDFTRDPGNYSLSATATFLAPVTGSYVFNYRVDPISYIKLYGPNKDSSICSDCFYDLEITVKDDCDNLIDRDTIAAGNVFDTSCVNMPDTLQGTMNVTLSKIGEYYITYTLKISQDALDFYDSTHLVKNSDIKKLNYFLLEELKKTDFSGCYSNCETCFDKLGTRAEFIQNFKLLYVKDSVMFGSQDSTWVSSLYDSLYLNCQNIQDGCRTNVCDEKLQLLKMDVIPGGQYALYDSAYNLLEPLINVLAKRDSIDFFTDEYGVRDSIMLVDADGNDSLLVDIKDLNDSLFIKNWKDIWADSLVRLHPEYCYYLWCITNDSSFEFDREIGDWADADTAIARGWFNPNDYKALLDKDPFFKAGANGAAFYNKMKKSLQYFSRSGARFGQADKNILQFIDISLYCRNQGNGWTACNPDSACRSRNREWFLYKHLYLNLKQKYYEEARRASNNPIFANCTNCYIGDDILAESGVSCTAPPVSDFTLIDSLGFKQYIIYKDTINGLKNSVEVDIEFRNNCFLPECPNGPYTLDTLTRLMNKGEWLNSFFYSSEKSNFRIIAVRCFTPAWQPFTDSNTCNYSCPEGVYDPFDRDSISFYVEYGEPGTSPSDTPAGYGNCQFYSVFDLQTGSNSSCRFFNVWVCVYDSICGGICPTDTTASYPSSCPANPNAALYKDKQRRYPEYVNTDALTDQLLSTNPQQQANQNTEDIAEQYALSCEAQADYWISVLRRCHPDQDTLNILKAALIEICTKGSSFTAPFGTSTIPASISSTYHSFEEAISAIIPGAFNDSCTAELLAMPYPYDRQPVFSERLIVETDYNICQKISQQRQAYLSSGFTGSFHQYLVTTFGSAYTLDSLDLADLLNACLNCNGILKNDIVLPLIFDPESKPCIQCDSITVAFDAFKTKFPAIDSTDDDYEILFTNFFNHRFGFALTYEQYRNFLDSCTADSLYPVQLCNKPVSEELAGDENACVKELFLSALINATNTYVAYIDSVHRDFREAWLTKCMNVEPALTMTANLYEYHYTLYYYDQSGNLVKTVPPEGVDTLTSVQIAQLQQYRNSSNEYCSNNNSMHFGNGSNGGRIDYYGGNNPQLSTGSNPFSIEFFIKLENFNDQGIVSTGLESFPDSEAGFAVSIKNSRLNLIMCEGAVANRVEVQITNALSTYLSLNTWAHVVVQRVGSGTDGTSRIFINGADIPVSYVTNNFTTGIIDMDVNGSMFIGQAYKGGGWIGGGLRGNLRQFRIYQRVLSQAEARQNYMDYCGNAANNNALVFWEPFTEGQWIDIGGDFLILSDRIYKSSGLAAGEQSFETNYNSEWVPAHRLVTTYQYNSLNQVIQQHSPDGDTSLFFYDRLGRLTVSQNMKQLRQSSYDAPAGRYSYTKYDSLGRITEVGEKSGSITDIRDINMLAPAEVNNWLASGTDKQVTRTIYDDPINLTLQSYSTSRKRVVASIYFDNAGDAEGDSSLYVYDIIGNVKTLLLHNKLLVAADNSNGRKRIDYDYDLVSGKVNMVSYQHGKGDQFYYKYLYDADNRVIRSLSSRDKLIWTEDASYTYYLHGPLAKTELGQLKVQGIDYIYTLQGWLKGINSNALSPQYEMGQDGWSGTTFARISRDVYSFGLGYFANDYTPIGSGANAMNQAAYQHPGNTDNTGRQLFNGNISNTVVALSKIESGAAKGYSYGYDQLNRLLYMNQHTVSGSTWSNSNIISAYAESIAYDANGNILKYLRKGANAAAGPLNMDSLSYKYNLDGNGKLVNNRLNHVRDSVNSANYTVDIDNQSNNNYTYDRIGNLEKDVAEGIDTIRWTVYGKINRVRKSSGASIIDYGYDPGGNRISKKVIVSGDTTKTFYVRDAQGNVLAVYEKKNSDAITWEEQHLYGSSRLGMWNNDTIVPSAPPVVIGTTPIYDSLMLGSRSYELSNHLGNVLSVISDKKIGHNNGSNLVDYYIAEVLSQNDYYPFGMLQPGRKYESALGGYRYGFNGKENDNDVKGDGLQLDYGFRVYDPRLGKFLSVDPLTQSYPWNSPYSYAEGDLIRSIDVDGLEKLIVITTKDKFGRIESMAIEGIRDKDIKQGLDVNLKFVTGKKVTTRDVLIITRQQGKADLLSYDDLNENYRRQIRNAPEAEVNETDNNLPEGSIAQSEFYKGKRLKGANPYDDQKNEFFYSRQHFHLDPPKVIENKKGWYIYYNSGLKGNNPATFENTLVTSKVSEFDKTNPNANSKIVEVTLTGNKGGKSYLEEVKKGILENNKNLNIKVNIKIDPKWKPDPTSISTDVNKDYNFSIKVSGVHL